MTNLFKENGTPNEGNRHLEELKVAFSKFMEQEQINAMNIAESRTMLAYLKSLVDQELSSQITEIGKLQYFNKTTFPDYLVQKYGKNWGFSSLTKEEYAFWFKLHPVNNK